MYDRRCSNCNLPGHTRRHCTNPACTYRYCVKCNQDVSINEFGYYTRPWPNGVSQKVYQKWCKDCHLKFGQRCGICSQPDHKSPECSIVDREPYPCRRCKRLCLTNEFPFCRGIRKTICKQCDSKYHKNYLQINLQQYFKLRLAGARNNMSKRNLPVTVGIEFLIQLLQSQQWKCYYSGLQMTTDNKETLISIDRKDSSLGYTETNIVLCCQRVNYMKRELDDDRFIDLCKAIASNHE